MARILIIGGGVSGLSAGIYAQASGHEAIICERGNTIGGNLTGWQRGEYHIDNCIHWLTGTNPSSATYKIWQELGALGDVEILQNDTLYTCEYLGQQLSLTSDLSTLERSMLEIAPSDKKEIILFIRAIKDMQGICGIGGKNHDEKYGKAKIIKSVPLLLRYHKLSTGELAKRFTHPLLKSFISCFLGDNFASLALIMVFAHFCGENGGIPKGSSCAMAQRMAEKFSSLGGTILFKKEASKINYSDCFAHSVDFADGTSIQADYIVITTDPKITFGKLLDLEFPKQLTSIYNNKHLIRFSSYQCAFACQSDALPFKGDFIFEIPKDAQEKLHTKHLILREFSHEKEFSPPGENIIQALVFCSEKASYEFISLKENPTEYAKAKNEISAIISSLIIQRFPQLKNKIKCIDVWTPATYKRYVNSEIGSFMSFALPPRFLPIRLSNRIKGLKNVFLATQWQQAPGGLPIAAKGGKIAIETICRLERQSSKYKLRHKKPVKASN